MSEWFADKIVVTLSASGETPSLDNATTGAGQGVKITRAIQAFNQNMTRIGSDLKIEVAGDLSGIQKDYRGQAEYSLNATLQSNPVPYLGSTDLGSVSVTPNNINKFLAALESANAKAGQYAAALQAGNPANLKTMEVDVRKLIRGSLTSGVEKDAGAKTATYAVSFEATSEAPTRDAPAFTQGVMKKGPDGFPHPVDEYTATYEDLAKLAKATKQLSGIMPGIGINGNREIVTKHTGIHFPESNEIGDGDSGDYQFHLTTYEKRKDTPGWAALLKDYNAEKEQKIVIKKSDGETLIALPLTRQNVDRLVSALNAGHDMETQMRGAANRSAIEVEVPKIQTAVEKTIKANLGIK
jgi:hypothetical protein